MNPWGEIKSPEREEEKEREKEKRISIFSLLGENFHEAGLLTGKSKTFSTRKPSHSWPEQWSFAFVLADSGGTVESRR